MDEPLLFSGISTDDISAIYKKDVSVAVLRLDRLHPFVSGNKWFKLRFYIDVALAENKQGILTWGGAWSNHILATAAYCQMKELRCAGIIRGEEPATWSPTLVKAKQLGMQLVFVSRKQYADREIPSSPSFTDYYEVPEGGFGELGARGAASIADYAKADFTHYIGAAGTGTMVAGLIRAASTEQQVTGISVLKNNASLDGNISSLSQGASAKWELLHDYHFGGYAKTQPALFDFMNALYKATNIPTDFVYTGKLFYAVSDLIQNNHFPAGSRLLVIHSGGLQGNESLPKGTLIF